MKNFQLYELVDKHTYETEGEAAWNYFDPDALLMLDDLSNFFSTLRGKHIPIICNNWHNGGDFQFRGYRPPSYPAHLSPLGSAHRIGKAFDVDIDGYTADASRRVILANQSSTLLSKIKRIEAKVNWVHMDILPHANYAGIYIFNA